MENDVSSLKFVRISSSFLGGGASARRALLASESSRMSHCSV